MQTCCHLPLIHLILLDSPNTKYYDCVIMSVCVLGCTYTCYQEYVLHSSVKSQLLFVYIRTFLAISSTDILGFFVKGVLACSSINVLFHSYNQWKDSKLKSLLSQMIWMIGTVYRNYHRSVPTLSLSFQIFSQRSCDPQVRSAHVLHGPMHA